MMNTVPDWLQASCQVTCKKSVIICPLQGQISLQHQNESVIELLQLPFLQGLANWVSGGFTTQLDSKPDARYRTCTICCWSAGMLRSMCGSASAINSMSNQALALSWVDMDSERV